MSFAEQIVLDCNVFSIWMSLPKLTMLRAVIFVSVVKEISSEKWSDGTQLTEFDNSVSVKKPS